MSVSALRVAVPAAIRHHLRHWAPGSGLADSRAHALADELRQREASRRRCRAPGVTLAATDTDLHGAIAYYRSHDAMVATGRVRVTAISAGYATKTGPKNRLEVLDRFGADSDDRAAHAAGWHA